MFFLTIPDSSFCSNKEPSVWDIYLSSFCRSLTINQPISCLIKYLTQNVQFFTNNCTLYGMTHHDHNSSNSPGNALLFPMHDFKYILPHIWHNSHSFCVTICIKMWNSVINGIAQASIAQSQIGASTLFMFLRCDVKSLLQSSPPLHGLEPRDTTGCMSVTVE